MVNKLYGLFNPIISVGNLPSYEGNEYIGIRFTSHSIDESLLLVLFKRENDNYVECIRYVNSTLIEDNNNIKLRFDYDKTSQIYKTNFIIEYVYAETQYYKIIMNNDEKYYYITEEDSYQLLEGETLNIVELYVVGETSPMGSLIAGTDKASIPYLGDLTFKIEDEGSNAKIAVLKFAKYLENVISATMWGMGYYQERSESLQNISYGLKYDEIEHIWKLLHGNEHVIATSPTLTNIGGGPVEWEKVDKLTAGTFKTYVYEEGGQSIGFNILNSDKFDEIIE
jgi:hypothetical protein